jgi:hypothetical protein
MDSYERGSQSELCTAQRISLLADTLSFPPTPKKNIRSADLVNWCQLPYGDKFYSILGDMLPVYRQVRSVTLGKQSLQPHNSDPAG